VDLVPWPKNMACGRLISRVMNGRLGVISVACPVVNEHTSHVLLMLAPSLTCDMTLCFIESPLNLVYGAVSLRLFPQHQEANGSGDPPTPR
jgi:hypothetical protein